LTSPKDDYDRTQEIASDGEIMVKV
jgi:hypothetical protein